jgi:ATP-dependent DNA helicase RecG
MDHPETEVIEAGEERSIHIDRVAPVYPLTEGLPQRWLRALIWRALARFGKDVEELWPGLVLPDLPSRAEAVRLLHFPQELNDAQKARERLALDEFLELQVAIQRRRRNLVTQAIGWPCGGDNRLIKPFLGQLGFELTGAQTRVLRVLRHDLSGPHPMRRLIQGDVGCGKTVVAACCALMAIESGFNVALMAPTEILADQHFGTFSRWFRELGVVVELQTGSHKTAPTHRTASGAADLFDAASRGGRHGSLFIGTHALIQSAFAMPNLGLVIIDEQHKFGVAQREQLVRKGRYPHLLVLTATPIPRTLGLTIYGDLDHSVIDELPAGRGRVRTFVRSAAQLSKVHEFIRQKVGGGRQAYIVFPRVDEGDASAGIKAVTQEFQKLQPAFAPHSLGLLHGRLRPEEKERVMAAFCANRIKVLLSTSVIEVGIDVPNATVMLIENADQFGLAQLHQLRGRIGRGAQESYCILLTERATEEVRRRLNVLVSSNDGFAIAEADLKLRGPGDLLGQHQSGMPPLRFGDLAADRALIERARDLAGEFLE